MTDLQTELAALIANAENDWDFSGTDVFEHDAFIAERLASAFVSTPLTDIYRFVRPESNE